MKPKFVNNTTQYRSQITGNGGIVILGPGESSPNDVEVSSIIPQGGDAVITTTNLEGISKGADSAITGRTITYPVTGRFGPVTCDSGEVWVYLS